MTDSGMYTAGRPRLLAFFGTFLQKLAKLRAPCNTRHTRHASSTWEEWKSNYFPSDESLMFDPKVDYYYYCCTIRGMDERTKGTRPNPITVLSPSKLRTHNRSTRTQQRDFGQARRTEKKEKLVSCVFVLTWSDFPPAVCCCRATNQVQHCTERVLYRLVACPDRWDDNTHTRHSGAPKTPQVGRQVGR